jgi:uncharacterized protein YciU (UPF0263 family)
MPQFKECTVDELLRDSLIEFSLKHNNRTMFDLLTGKNWKDHVVKEENEEKYNEDNTELHNTDEDFVDFVSTLFSVKNTKYNKQLYNLSLKDYSIYGVDWAKTDFCCDLSDVLLNKYMKSKWNDNKN